MKRLFKAIYFTPRFYSAVIITITVFLLGIIHSFIYQLAWVLLIGIIIMIIVEALILSNSKYKVTIRRVCSERFSNGDDNKVELYFESFYPFRSDVKIIDEIPYQFQRRDNAFGFDCQPYEKKKISYVLKPVERGVYAFGQVNVYVSVILKLIERRYRFDEQKDVKVYPSYLMLRHYELLAISNQLSEIGIKKIRKIGHNIEFEHIKEYVKGDDYRTINWKATARKGDLMVNVYQDEKSQNVYSLIDMGRVMQMPFEGMSLLDYAINASLVISNIAIRREDKAGLMTFEAEFNTYLPAERRKNQMPLILETLYNQYTTFGESDFSKLYVNVKSKIRQRSLLLLYTNFESMYSLERQLTYLMQLNQSHLLVVIFFKNTELDRLLHTTPKSTRGIYNKVIAEKFSYEKELIVTTLRKHGIQSILTKPQDLTVDVINKYIELKSRRLI